MFDFTSEQEASVARMERTTASQGAVVVTGASAGVGRATALAFARRGVRLALIARGTEGLEAARRDAEAAGAPQALALPTDTTDAAAVFAAADRAAAELGRIGTWVNCAMATVFAPVQAMTPEEFRRVTEVTYLGYVHGTLAALRHMQPRNAGTIVSRIRLPSCCSSHRNESVKPRIANFAAQ